MSFIASATNAKHIRILADLLGRCSIGGRVTHDQMMSATKRDRQSVAWIVPRARRLINDETGAIFKCIRGVGYERMPANLLTSVGDTTRTHVRKVGRQSVRMMANALGAANDLSRDEVLRGHAAITQMGVIVMMARDDAAPKLPDSILPPDPADTARASLEALRGALGRRKT